MKASIKGSRGNRARHNNDALLYVGIDAPINIAWGKLHGGREYLFMSAAPGEGVNIWLRQTLRTGVAENRRRRRTLLKALGIFVGRLHATGFIHGDLRPGNILAAEHEGRFRFTLIDNERNVQKVPPPGKMILRNLMQLNMLAPVTLSRSDRMCFFMAWRRQMKDLSITEAKILGAEAYLWAMRRLAEKNPL